MKNRRTTKKARSARKQLAANSGLTMVEVIVAFTILMMGIAMTITTVRLAGNMQKRTTTRRAQLAELEERICAGDIGAALTGDSETWSFQGYGFSFTLPVNVETHRVTTADGSASIQFTIISE